MSLLAGAAISAGMGAVQSIMGIGKSIKANRMRKKAQSFFAKNQYEIPESATAALTSAERQAGNIGLPGADIARAKMGESTGRGVHQVRSAATSASDILASVAGLYAGEQRGEVDLGLKAATRYDANQAMLRGELGRMAGYETEKWKYNVLYPYQQMMETAGQMQGQGSQMISAGIGQIGSAAGAYMQGISLDKQIAMQEKALGLGGNGTATAPLWTQQTINGIAQPDYTNPFYGGSY